MRQHNMKSVLCAVQQVGEGKWTLAIWFKENFVMHVAHVATVEHANKWLAAVKERNPKWEDVKDSREWVKMVL